MVVSELVIVALSGHFLVSVLVICFAVWSSAGMGRLMAIYLSSQGNAYPSIKGGPFGR